MSNRRIADLVIKIGANSYEFKQKTEEVERGLDGLTKKLDQVGKEMSLKLTAPIAAVGALSVKLYDTQAKAEAKVKQAIEATGGAAKLTFEQLTRMASEFQGKSLFGDEKILNDSTAKLLTFTNIAGDNFKRTQAAVLDLSTAMDMDLKSATIAVGKALNDPVKGLSSLSRIGITFLKDQERLIRNFAETNRLGEAQAVILGELEKKYKGQAQAAAKEGMGALQQLKNSWGDFLEQMGRLIMPFVNKVAQALQALVDKLQALDPRLQKMIVLVLGIVAAIGPLVLTLGTLLKFLPMLKAGFALLVSPITLVRTAIHKLTLAISANPFGLLLTALSTGITLFMAFGRGAKDAAEANGELTNKVIEESRQVNLLIGKLTSSTTAEKDRKEALEELNRIQPDIVAGLHDEKTELEKLTQRAVEYNQQLVLRIALARKQDAVEAAINKKLEIGADHASKTASLYGYLVDIGTKLNSGNFEFGRHNNNKGFYEWAKATEGQQKYMVGKFNEIMASGETLDEKARQILLLFSPPTNYADKIRMDGVTRKQIQSMRGDVSKFEGQLESANDLIADAQNEVKIFMEAFGLPIPSTLDDAANAASNAADSFTELGEAARKSIEQLNDEIQELEKLRSKSTDPAEITKFNQQIDALKAKIEDINKLGRSSGNIQGRLAELNAQLKKVEERKLSTFDTLVIAECNAEIAALKKEIDYLNNVLPVDLIPRQSFEPILSGNLANLQPITIPLELKMPELKSPFAKMAEQIKTIRNYIQEEMFGWTDQISGRFKDDVRDIEGIVKTYVDALVEKGWTFEAALEHVGSKVRDTIKSFDDSLSNFLANSIVAAAESIGQIMVGDLGFGGLMKNILLQFANFLKQIGAQLIQFGLMIVAFKSALKSVLANPWAAIGVGAAMIAAAAVMTALINKNAKKNVPKLAKGGLAYGPTYAMVGDNLNASVDPEVIAPLSKLKNMMGNGGTANVAIQLSGELTAKGRDLVYVLGRENFKTDILGT